MSLAKLFFLKNPRPAGRRAIRRRRPDDRRRVVLEPLEPRMLLSGTPVQDGVLASLDAAGALTPKLTAGDDDVTVRHTGINDDTLIGGAGDDRLTGGRGNDSLVGGAGTDTVLESADTDFMLTDTSLTGRGTDSLGGIERASLTRGAGDNTLDASVYTLGSVTLHGGAGDDSLIGGRGNDSLAGGIRADTVAGSRNTDVALTDASLPNSASHARRGGNTSRMPKPTGPDPAVHQPSHRRAAILPGEPS